MSPIPAEKSEVWSEAVTVPSVSVAENKKEASTTHALLQPAPPAVERVVETLLDPVSSTLVFIAAATALGDIQREATAAWAILSAVIVFFIFRDFRICQAWKEGGLGKQARSVLLAWIVTIGLLASIAAVTESLRHLPADTLVTWAVISPVAILFGHAATRWVRNRATRATTQRRTAAIVGANPAGERLAQAIELDGQLNIDVIGFFDDRNRARLQGMSSGMRLLGTASDVVECAKVQKIDLVFLALPLAQQQRIVDLVTALRDTTASVYFIPDLTNFDPIQGRLENVQGIPVISVCDTPLRGANNLFKSIADFVFGSIFLVIAAPVMLAIAVAIKLSSPGPVFFKQRRYGLDGCPFNVLKFRTMTVCEDGQYIRQASRDDERVTPLGRLLRRSSLDELPQLFNVLKGQMSLVGPRPHAVAHNEMYRKLIAGYMVRHKVKPGMTGWAQVHGLRGETDTVEKMQRRVEYDIDYLKQWSPGMDLRIMLMTLSRVCCDKNSY